MTTRDEWGPRDATPLVVLVPRPPEDARDVVAAVRTMSDRLDVPLQALRADRVVSPHHLLMAATHAERARRAGRARANDPTVEFLLYAACDRQIQGALARLGIPPGGSVAALLVPLGSTTAEALDAAVRAAGFEPSGWRPDPNATDWWRTHLGLPRDAGPRQTEDALLGAMAALAVAKQ
ncbi:MAG: hypothetical protein KY455_09400 [Euryarchaeota archaeon]|nr:hypothetical protein [Euryarchaeota archaeon]